MQRNYCKGITASLKRCTVLLLSGILLLSASFTSLNTAAAGGFQTTLSGLSAVNGNWRETTSGLYSEGGGDIFCLSNTTAADFIFEATVTFNQKSGAASLVFFSGNQPGSSSYCANIDLNYKNARIFKFGYGGGDVGVRNLPSYMLDKNTYTLRVEAIGASINYFVDDLLIVSAVDENRPQGGRLGFLTYDTKVTYQNVIHKDLSSIQVPTLKSLNISGIDLNNSFDGSRYSYHAKIPHDQVSAVFTPVTADGASATVIAADSSGTRVSAQQNGSIWTVPVGEKDLDFIVQVTKGDVTLQYIIRAEKLPAPNTMYRDKYRPQFHFSPFKNFMNDPNGLVYDPSNGTYHMFYQYNPSGLNIGNQVWGHAESTDMIHWTQAPDLAIIQDDGLGAIFSGSAVVDENNTSGLFTDNKPGESKLVALFTHDGGDRSKGNEKQSLAYSKDHGHTWIKPKVASEGFTNPVISNEGNKYGGDFRDPKVFWHDNRWMMVVAGGDARLFTSNDLIHWDFAGNLNMYSECPDLFPLAVDGNQNNIKWVYLASGRWYVIGDLQRDSVINGVQQYKFVKETEQIPYNGGPNVYATQSFYNDGSGKNRRMMISWLQDNSASQLSEAGKTWNGVQTIPYETTLKTVNGQIRLFSYPTEEIKTARGDQLISISGKSVNTGDENFLGGYGAQKLDLEAVFTPGTATEFGLKLRQGSGEEIIVKYNAVSKKFILDQTKSGKIKSGVYSTDMAPMKDGKIKMRILVDASVLEAFGNDGEASNTVMFFPTSDSIGMEFFTNGTVTVDSLNIYKMKSIWYEEAPETLGMKLSDSNINLVMGDSYTITAAILPKPESKKVTWSIDSGTIIESKKQQNYSITVKALKPGTAKITATLAETGETKEIQVSVMEDPFKTNLSDWNYLSGRWFKDEKGLNTDGVSGSDVFAISGKTADIIQSYEAVTIPTSSGGCPSLIFGVTNPSLPSGGTWFGANIDTSGGKANAKLFQNTSGSERWRVTKEVPIADSYHLKITVLEDKIIAYYVNDTLIGQQKAVEYTGGFLGLLTWNSAASFNSVYYSGPNDTDKSDLQELYSQLKDKQSYQYTAESWSVFEQALKTAETVLDNPEATEDSIDAAKLSLANAATLLISVKKGDVDRDGLVTVSDVVDLRRIIIVGTTDKNKIQLCDIDGDQTINVSDVVALRQLIMKGA